jgi:hypothetical protein
MSLHDTCGELVTLIDRHGRVPVPAVGERDWTCPVHATEAERELADRISAAYTDLVGEALAADDLGSFGELAACVSEDIESRGLSPEERGQRWVQFMAMSLGYWLDCMVSDEVADRTGASEEQVMDVALLRERVRRQVALEGADGGAIPGWG